MIPGRLSHTFSASIRTVVTVRNMSKYELKYINRNGRAGAIRMMLDYMKVPFTDTVIDKTEWPKFKASMPFAQVPVLDVPLESGDKLVLPQSVAILRYLATKHGLLADSLEDQARCDAFADQLQDFIQSVRPYIWSITRNGTPEDRETKYNEIFLPAMKKEFVPIFETQLNQNDTGFLVGKKLTWVDFFVAEFVDRLSNKLTKDADRHLIGSTLHEYRDRVFALPNLEERIASRAQFIF